MAFPPVFPILLIFSLMGSGFAENEPSPRGCGSLLKRPFTVLCDLDAVWGVAVAVAAGGAALASLILGLVLLCRLRRITEAESRSGVAPLLLLLATIIMLCAVSFASIIERDDHVCIARHGLWGALLVLSIAYLVTQGVRLLRISSFRALAALMIGLAIMHGIVFVEWILGIVLHPDQPACQYQPLHIAVVFMYSLALVTAVPMTLASGLTQGQPQWRGRILCLLVMSFISAIVWVISLSYYRAMKVISDKSSSLEDQVQAVGLVVQAWLVLLFHAAPEAHACLRPAPQPSNPADIPAQAPQHLQEASLEAGIPLPLQQIVESQGSAFDSRNSGSRHQWNGSTEPTPSTSFHIEKYELAERNSSTELSMPSTSTGWQL